MRKPVSRDAIVRAAVDLMAEHGLAAMTLRRLATQLGVSAPTLYWHVANKRELLDHVAEHLMHHCRTAHADRPAPGQPWWDWLEQRGRTMYRLIVAVPDAPQVIAGNRPTIDTLPGIDTALGELVAVGFPPAEAQQVFFVLGGYIGGMALEAQAEATRAGSGVDDSALHSAVLDADRFPHLASAITAREPCGHDDTFDYGLRLLVLGIRARHAELTGADSPV